MPPRVAFTLGCLECDLVAALHGPADVRGDLAFLPMGGSGFIIADISDPANITEISRLDFGPLFGPTHPSVHTTTPYLEPRGATSDFGVSATAAAGRRAP